MSKKGDLYTAAFEKRLIRYQKSSFTLMLHPLVSAFVWMMGALGMNLGIGLRMPFSLMISYYMREDILINSVVSFSVLVIFILLVILAVKGKLWALTTASVLYTIDFALLFFLIGKVEVITFILELVLHLAFSVAIVFAHIFYFQADAMLKNPK